MHLPRLSTTLLFLGAATLGLAQTNFRFLGDSISAGVGASTPAKRYTTLLANTLGLNEINPSISGGTLTDKSYVAHMFDYWESTFLNGDANDYALIYLGVNDTGWIDAHPEQGAVFAARLDTIVTGLLNYGYKPSRIIVCSPYYFGGLEPARTTVWNAIHDTAEAHGIVFADFWAHAGSWGWKSTYLPDGIHPNDAGHQLLHDWVLEAIANHTGAPQVSLTSPTEGALVLSGEAVAIAADASDETAIAEVRFYLDDTLVHTATGAPYAFSWTATGLGAHTLRAVAEDTDGESAEDSLTLTVVDGFPPAVAITAPAADTHLYVDESLAVAADASDSDGTVARVEFYLDDALAATDTAAPYTFDLTSTQGAHVLFARAIDDDGNPTDSAPRTVTFLPRPGAGIVAAINCGSTDPFPTGAGLTYAADDYVTGGSTRLKVQEINLTEDDTLYHSYRVGDFAYEIPVADGLYEVTLHVIEPYWTGAGNRVFNIDVEGVRTHQDLDLFALYGKANATDLVITDVAVADGFLSLAFAATIDGAVLNAILVRELDPPPPPTPLETWLQAELGVSTADLASDDDLDGIPLLMEYALDLDPGAADTLAGLVALSPTAPATLTFPRDPAKSEIHYIVETSPDLAVWTERFGAADGATPNSAGALHTVSVGTEAGPLFVRLRIVLAP